MLTIVHRPNPGFLGGLLLLIAAVAASDQAAAEVSFDWYAKLGLGWSYPDDLQMNELGGKAEFDLGLPVVSAAFGATIGDNWRLEIEASRLHNEFEVLSLLQAGIAIDPEPTDSLDADTISLNLLRDFRVGRALRPYFGVGIGLTHAQLELQESGIQGISFTRPPREIIDDDDQALAYQIIAGFVVPFSRRWELGVEYRFWQAPELEFTDTDNQKLDLEHSVHSGWLQLGYHFNDRPRPQTRTSNSAHGWYLSAAGGVSYATDSEIDGSLANYDAFDLGPIYLLTAGYDPGGKWRYEIEWSQRKNDVEIVDFNPERGERTASGRVRADALMINALRRFQPGAGIRSFLGSGIGAVAASYDVKTRDGDFTDDETTGIAVQFIAGFEISLTPHLTFTADYRPWITNKMSYELSNGTDVKSFHLVHSASLGLRYSFGS